VGFRLIDTAIFIIANMVNLLMVGIFLSRPRGLKKVERTLGLIIVSLALPVAIAVILNLRAGREWWTVVLPSILILFLAVELFLDTILRLDFRKTRLLWPYLLLYYLALMAMIGYSFLIGAAFGFVTLGTYFLNLISTWYSYSKVGHGS
jgi:hypothetical protein